MKNVALLRITQLSLDMACVRCKESDTVTLQVTEEEPEVGQ